MTLMKKCFWLSHFQDPACKVKVRGRALRYSESLIQRFSGTLPDILYAFEEYALQILTKQNIKTCALHKHLTAIYCPTSQQQRYSKGHWNIILVITAKTYFPGYRGFVFSKPQLESPMFLIALAAATTSFRLHLGEVRDVQFKCR